ncbi:MAG: sulfur carrier protein ThiS [Aquisalinus sp.]|nr:sulfur carrier protein ThiS [Aquisalinus sp.]
MKMTEAQTLATIQVSVNGKNREISDGCSVSALLTALELKPVKIAIELNREIVPKSAFDSTVLKSGDQLEIVQFVGGG